MEHRYRGKREPRRTGTGFATDHGSSGGHLRQNPKKPGLRSFEPHEIAVARPDSTQPGVNQLVY